MPTDSPELKAASDDDWKEQMRAENAELDRQAGAATGGASPGDPAEGGSASRELPAADFPTLVEMLAMQGLVALGMVPHPVSGKPDPQLPLAKHFIDLLGILETKTGGNLTADETSLLGGSLHYLRMSYIELSKRPPNREN